jgi:hypothetical protein
MMKNRRIYIWIVFLFAGVAGMAQEGLRAEAPVEERPFDRDHWKETIKDINYSAERAQKVKGKEEGGASGDTRRNPNEQSEEQQRFISGPMASILLKVLIIIAVAIVVFLLVRSFLGIGIPRNRKVDPDSPEIDLEQIEENIHESDFRYYINKALEQQNYKLAVRLYYLHLLKELSTRALIRWKKEKTNRDYLLELRKTPLAHDFSQLTMVFDRVWYGGDTLSETEYRALEPHFQAFDQQIAAATT